MARETGTVKWFSNEKGYGFIERDEAEDVFVHHSDIQGEGFKTLQAGEAVEFEILASDRGPKAQRVVRLEQSADGDGAAPQAATFSGSSARSRETSAGEAGRDGSTSESGSRTLAEQLREKIGRRFFGG